MDPDPPAHHLPRRGENLQDLLSLSQFVLGGILLVLAVNLVRSTVFLKHQRIPRTLLVLIVSPAVNTLS